MGLSWSAYMGQSGFFLKKATEHQRGQSKRKQKEENSEKFTKKKDSFYTFEKRN